MKQSKWGKFKEVDRLKNYFINCSIYINAATFLLYPILIIHIKETIQIPSKKRKEKNY